jgi:hypothetical protein
MRICECWFLIISPLSEKVGRYCFTVRRLSILFFMKCSFPNESYTKFNILMPSDCILTVVGLSQIHVSQVCISFKNSKTAWVDMTYFGNELFKVPTLIMVYFTLFIQSFISIAQCFPLWGVLSTNIYVSSLDSSTPTLLYTSLLEGWCWEGGLLLVWK